MSEVIRTGSEAKFSERDLTLIPIEIIDETDPENILSSLDKDFILRLGTTSSPVSSEGFHQDIEGQHNIADFLHAKFGDPLGEGLLDVGFGQNLYVSRRLSDSGIRVCAIDVRQDPRWAELYREHGDFGHFDLSQFFHEPRKEKEIAGIRIFSGDIMELSNYKSGLLNDRFGLILFNGSWHSTGINYHVVGSGEHKKQIGSFYVEYNRRMTLEACSDHLTENGLIGIISSRYAFHGEGYPYGHWPIEKAEFAELFLSLVSLGAKNFYLVGLSNIGFDTVYERSYEAESDERKRISEWRTSVPLVKEKLVNFTSSVSMPLPNVFNRLARIDALFARF